MIEIIREEETSGTTEKRGLPKDIKQIGRPDIGDRIYVENQVYQFLHPYNSLEEKKAYVLLGRFENYAGRQCVFVEAAIPLKEIDFDGELPLWNDQTWAYIYKQLKREYDSMVIVGWAMDIKGQLPNMTVRLENLHQQNFGGAHQVLYLMDSLECEEAFYGSRNGCLYRREGFYIYYEKHAANRRERHVVEAEPYVPEKERYGLEKEFYTPEKERYELEKELYTPEKERYELEKELYAPEKERYELEKELYAPEKEKNESQKEQQEVKSLFSEKSETESKDIFGQEPRLFYRGSYRKQMSEEKEPERPVFSSYATTVLLLAVVCVLGVTAHLNHKKMTAMEETLAQMNQTQNVATEQGVTSNSDTPEVMVETVSGNVQKQTAETDQTTSAVGQAGAASVTNNVPTDEAASATESDTANANASATGDTSEIGGTLAEDTSATGAASAAGSALATGSASETGDTSATGSTLETGSASEAGDTSTTETSGEASVATEAQTYLSQGYYVVQKGDSLVGICKKIYQTTAMLDKLCEVNGIEDQDSIYAGQYLTLPN